MATAVFFIAGMTMNLVTAVRWLDVLKNLLAWCGRAIQKRPSLNEKYHRKKAQEAGLFFGQNVGILETCTQWIQKPRFSLRFACFEGLTAGIAAARPL